MEGRLALAGRYKEVMGNNTSAEQRKGAATTWLLLGGVFLILLAVLGVTTHDRLQRSGELMEQSLTQHGVLVVRSLEGATRAGMRRGMWRLNLLQALAEEMADQPHVHSITIIGHNGDILAAAGRGKAMGSVNQPDPLAGLPLEAETLVKSYLPLTHFAHNELVVGRPFEPLRRYVARRGALPPWACALDNTTPQPRRPPRPRGREMMHPPIPGMPPPPDARVPRTNAEQVKGYALVRMSTDSFQEVRWADLKQAFALAALIFLAAGAVAVAVAVYARRRDSEIERLRREVSENRHLAAVGRLSASVAHEVRNPLSALRGMVQFLTKDADPDSREAEYGKVAVSEVDRLNRVVTSLLEYSRPRPPRRMELDLGELIHSVVELLADDPLATEVDMQIKVAQDLPAIKADPDQIRQVLVNLVVNALQAMNGSGRLEIEALPKGSGVAVRVSDNGPGLDTDDFEEVFDPFYSTRERGTGLGLAIARRIVRGHGGDITARNLSKGGARFTLSLPPHGEEP